MDDDPSQFPPGWKFWEDGPIAQEHGISTRQEFVELVYRLGTTDNGVFGIKLMWNNLPWVTRRLEALPQFQGLDTAALLPAVFPDMHVVQIIRRDRLPTATGRHAPAYGSSVILPKDRDTASSPSAVGGRSRTTTIGSLLSGRPRAQSMFCTSSSRCSPRIRGPAMRSRRFGHGRAARSGCLSPVRRVAMPWLRHES